MDACNQHSPPTTVVIAAAVRLYREGLAAMVATHEKLRVAGVVATAIEARAVVNQLRPHVLIIDVAIDDAIDLMRAVRADSAPSRILALAVQEEITAILDYAQAGADGFVTSDSSVDDLFEAIQRMVAGELMCSPRIAAELLRRAAQRGDPRPGNSRADCLTGRETDVFALLRTGKSNKEIARTLNIAEATVKNHVHHLLEKMHVSNRGKAAAIAHPTRL